MIGSGGIGSFTELETSLCASIVSIAPTGAKIGCRLIRAGDDARLLTDEAFSIKARDLSRRRASGAARAIAHRLLAEFGLNDFAILRAASGAPIWPDTIVGSLAHDDEMAIAVVSSTADRNAIGIDIEPALPLPDDVLELVTTPQDKTNSIASILAGRILFAAKEAVYKAAYPHDQKILNYDDIAVDLTCGHARTATGRVFNLTFCIDPKIVVLVFDR